ncbi:hypothetical protein [Clostridium sp. LIBA-8841]|uniref:hypothetical protein n=1 Tax=Clostridium sp. LIBA-8841 TaxID=2987530 RepID=UPI002AC73F0A|nr:hypothetical protein [Clostridium sp. LIBA-8841]MDZ5252574.1 hypothetical protein [Clostridium sp. LIBA-8841]
MKNRKKIKMILLMFLMILLFSSNTNVFAKENPNTIEFLGYEEEIIVLKSPCETVVISEGNNIESILEGVNKENLGEIDLLVLNSFKEESNEFIEEAINNSNIKKILIPTLGGLNEETKSLMKSKNIEITSMEEGFNYNKESISLNAKRVDNSNEGMIFATVDNIKIAVLSKESYDKALELSKIEDCRVEILNLNDGEEKKKEIKKLVKNLNPLVIIENSENNEFIKKMGVKHFNLNEEKGIKIMRVLGETKEFEILSRKEGYTK